MSSERIDFGEYLHELRKSNGYSQKHVASKLGIDISMLSKIEHGERHVQEHMLKPISELFDLNLKNLQITFWFQKIDGDLSSTPYAQEVVEEWLRNNRSRKKI